MTQDTMNQKWTAKEIVSFITAISAAAAVFLGAWNKIQTEEIHHLVNATATKQLQDLKDLQAKNDMLQKLLENLGNKLEQPKSSPAPLTVPVPVEVKVVNPTTQPVPTITPKEK